MLTRAIVIYANGQDTMMTSSVIGSNAYPEGDICMHLLDALLNGTMKEYIASLASLYDGLDVNAMTAFTYKYDESSDTLSIHVDNELKAVITRENALQWKLLFQNTNLIYHAAAKGLDNRVKLKIDLWSIENKAVSTGTVYDLIAFAEKSANRN